MEKADHILDRWILEVEELLERLEALESTLKTANGMTQLAMQQLSALRKGIAGMKERVA